MDSRDNQVEQIFSAALMASDPGTRRTLLEEACGSDAPLRSRVEALLDAHDSAGSFLEPLVIDPRETVLSIRSETPPAEAPGKTIGRYKLAERIGEGGFGVVYLAEQSTPVRRQVALKILKLGMDTEQVIARFEAERQVLAMMDHPNIARVFDAGATDTGRPYFVMELVRGVPITNYCEENRLTVAQRLELFLVVCDAVQHAHQKGVIHRDIKPSNVLVALQGTLTIPKIIDFGVAKAAAHHLTDKTLYTSFGEFVGTPAYMSPDQTSISGMDVDTRTDIYSLGVLLYELVVGKTPFDPRTLRQASYEEMCRIIREVDPVWPSIRIAQMGEELRELAWRRRTEPPALARSLRGDLDWIIMRAIEKDRVRRYQSATELAGEVRRHLLHQPVLAGPPGAAYRISKFIRRNRVPVIAASLAVIALLIGSALATVGFLKATRANVALGVQAAKSKAVSEFLQSMLASVDPSRALGREVTVRYALDEAARALADGALTSQPEVEAEIRTTLGRTYEALGDYDSAEAHLTAAAAIHNRELGERHPDTLRCQSLLAGLHLSRSRYSQAEALSRKTLQVQDAVLVKEHPDTLATMSRLSVALAQQDKLAEAEALQSQTLEIQRRVLGAEHVDTLRSEVHLGTILLDQDRNEQAERLLHDALNTHRRVLGKEHPETMVAMNSLAVALERSGKFSSSETLYRQSWETNRRILGPDHPRTQIPLNNLMRVLNRQGKIDEQRPLVAERLERLKRAAMRPDADALALSAYAWELVTCQPEDLRDPAAALPFSQRAVELDAGLDANILDTLALVQRMTGNLDQAIATQRRAVAQARAGGPYNLSELEQRLSEYLLAKGDLLGAAGISWQLANQIGRSLLPTSELGESLAWSARQHFETGQYADAEQVLHVCLAARQKDLPEGHWLVFETISLLGEVIAAQKNHSEAEKLLLEGFEGMSRDPHAPQERRQTAAQRLVQLYEAWGRPDDANRWRERLALQSGRGRTGP